MLESAPPGWVRDAVFYQVFPDRFARSGRVHAPGPMEPWDSPPTVNGFKGGDLYGVIDRLDHIQSLGATALYLNPVFASAANRQPRITNSKLDIARRTDGKAISDPPGEGAGEQTKLYTAMRVAPE